MTAAQKENIKRFKAVQAEAKKLKAKNKKLTHQEAVKQAWAIIYSKQRKAAPKKAAKKVGAVKKKAERKPTEKDILKKVHSAKASSKTLYNKLDKLDEAQHKHMNIGAIKSKGIKTLQKKYGDLAASKIMKTKKLELRKIAKEMSKVRTQIKKLASL